MNNSIFIIALPKKKKKYFQYLLFCILISFQMESQHNEQASQHNEQWKNIPKAGLVSRCIYQMNFILLLSNG